MRIALITAPTPYVWSPLGLDGLRGGEESIIGLAAALGRRGHAVTVAYDGPAIDTAAPGVTYQPRGAMDRAYDVAIFHNLAVDPTLAPQTILWTYQPDLAFDPMAPAHVVVSTPYMQRVFASRTPACASRLAVIPYGVDPITRERTAPRDPAMVLYASAPDRGLSTLLSCWPAVLAARPSARLVIAHGWEMFRACGGSPVVQAQIEGQIAATDRVQMLRFSRDGMDALYQEAGVWAYYCTGGESFCITGVKAQAAGCVPVVKPWGGLHDTVRSGLRASTPAEFQAQLIAALDPDRQEALRAEIPSDVAVSWDAVAAAWDPLFTTAGAVLASRIRLVPDTPSALRPDLPGRNAVGMVQQLMGQWRDGLNLQRPIADPTLGVQFPPITGPLDGVVVGWGLEDNPDPPHKTLQAMGIPPGTPVLLLTSTGPWRALYRQRHLSRRDLVELFGQQPDVGMRCSMIGTEGNGIFSTTFRYDPSRLGQRDLRRVKQTQSPRETLSVCLIVRDAEQTLLKTLESVVPIADEVVILDSGSLDGTADVIRQFKGLHPTLPVLVGRATSPRWCYDCVAEHPVGEMFPGHRVAGFETPRNESIAQATMDWVLWIDSDETLLHPERLAKYLHPSPFAGYSIPQDHHASDPPAAYKRDLPVRLFRRVVDPHDAVGLQPDGDHHWPTYHTGLTVRFCGIVHEHPGLAPNHADGLGPVMVLGDVWLAHVGYYTEHARRGRFVRNWPLMVADRQRYPGRRLGLFLWLRDLAHHVRYLREQQGGQMTADAVALAEEGNDLFRTYFLDTNDLMAGDALGYVTILLEALGRGIEIHCQTTARKPEVSGDEQSQALITGRVETADDFVRLLRPKLGEWERWMGAYL
jgi:glycosyltransferase involved in cell wall biosynthesis